jgi:hypothetical protein
MLQERELQNRVAILFGTTYVPKRGKTIPNYKKIYQMPTKYTNRP